MERILIPYIGDELPKKAEGKALEKLEKGGKLFLLHVVDEAPTRSIRYRTGQIGDESQIVKTFRETVEKVQEKSAKEYTEEVKERAAKKGISVEPVYSTGDPGQEVLKAIDEYSIDLVIVEQLRDRIYEIFATDEIDYVCQKASCDVQTVSD